jgi:hypothetical protein
MQLVPCCMYGALAAEHTLRPAQKSLGFMGASRGSCLSRTPISTISLFTSGSIASMFCQRTPMMHNWSATRTRNSRRRLRRKCCAPVAFDVRPHGNSRALFALLGGRSIGLGETPLEAFRRTRRNRVHAGGARAWFLLWSNAGACSIRVHVSLLCGPHAGHRVSERPSRSTLALPGRVMGVEQGAGLHGLGVRVHFGNLRCFPWQCGLTGWSTRTHKCVRARCARASCAPVTSNVRPQTWTRLIIEGC